MTRPYRSLSRSARLDVLCSLAWSRADRRVEGPSLTLAVEALALYKRLARELELARHPAQLRLDV